ncbi:unnamed protein product, partial [Ectocarpus fasciculatus]
RLIHPHTHRDELREKSIPHPPHLARSSQQQAKPGEIAVRQLSRPTCAFSCSLFAFSLVCASKPSEAPSVAMEVIDLTSDTEASLP